MEGWITSRMGRCALVYGELWNGMLGFVVRAGWLWVRCCGVVLPCSKDNRRRAARA